MPDNNVSSVVLSSIFCCVVASRKVLFLGIVSYLSYMKMFYSDSVLESRNYVEPG